MSDNPILNVSGRGLERLQTVLRLTEHSKARGYVTTENKIVFFWCDHKEMIPFPAETPTEDCARIAINWLDGVKYHNEPDIDGDCERGWRCFTEGWGHIKPYGYPAFIAVEPYWLMYGK